MIRLAKHYGGYGHCKVAKLLRIEGWHFNHKKIERLWQEEGLQLLPLSFPRFRHSTWSSADPRCNLRLKSYRFEQLRGHWAKLVCDDSQSQDFRWHIGHGCCLERLKTNSDASQVLREVPNSSTTNEIA